MKEIKSPFWRTIYEYGLITVSIWIMVVGIYFFKFPNHFAFGGITGFSTVVSQLTHWSASDFTPMVDMNMLLITFFMLCTTLSKPQTMEISMPSNDKKYI